jgi:hypothetical protein
LLLSGLFVDVQRYSAEGVVRSFNLSDSVVGLVELVTAGLVKLAKVHLGLLVLVDERS